MPLPLIIGISATIAGTVGVGSGLHGISKIKKAKETIVIAEKRHQENIDRFDDMSINANNMMDTLGELELKILNSFEHFSNIIERIQNRPQFVTYNKEGVSLPKYDKEQLKNVSVGAGILLGSLGGAVAGTAGGFAAAGATTSAVVALGTASTGTAISTLSGAAATNATLAVLGGGTIAAGGGGIALGTTVLSGATLGVGLLVGGIIFNVAGSKLSDNAEEAYRQMEEAENNINQICSYLKELSDEASKYIKTLNIVKDSYEEHLEHLSCVTDQKTNWIEFSDHEKILTQNTILLVGLLYNMCKVDLVRKAKNDKDINTINRTEIHKSIRSAKKVLRDVAS